MGETAADTRREIEETRAELDGSVHELRTRAGEVRAKGVRIGIRAGAIAAGGLASSAAVVGAVVLWRRQRGGRVAQAARRLPVPARPPAVSAARGFERWLGRRTSRLDRQREELMDALAQRIAESQATAQRRANPLWRRTAAKALETGATLGATALVRMLVDGRRREEPAVQLTAP